MIVRRSFLAGLGAMLAAPAIVHAGNLMPVRAVKPAGDAELFALLQRRIKAAEEALIRGVTENLYGDRSVGLLDLLEPPQVSYPYVKQSVLVQFRLSDSRGVV